MYIFQVVIDCDDLCELWRRRVLLLPTCTLEWTHRTRPSIPMVVAILYIVLYTQMTHHWYTVIARAYSTEYLVKYICPEIHFLLDVDFIYVYIYNIYLVCMFVMH